LALGLAGYIHAATRHGAHETLALELRHGLAHRRTADAKIFRKAALIKPDFGAAAIDIQGSDGLFQRGINLMLEVFRAGQRRDRGPRLSAVHRGPV
jgi:hypothetical protein